MKKRCKQCKKELELRLAFKDEEDNKTKKLYVCSECIKYHLFVDNKMTETLKDMNNKMKKLVTMF